MTLVWEHGAAAQIAPGEVRSSHQRWPWCLTPYPFREPLEDPARTLQSAGSTEWGWAPPAPRSCWVGQGLWTRFLLQGPAPAPAPCAAGDSGSARAVPALLWGHPIPRAAPQPVLQPVIQINVCGGPRAGFCFVAGWREKPSQLEPRFGISLCLSLLSSFVH